MSRADRHPGAGRRGPLRLLTAAIVIALPVAAAPAAIARPLQCGWVVSAGPERLSFRGADGDWQILAPELAGAPANWRRAPRFRESRDWVDTGNGAGYGCACMDLVVSVGARLVLAYHGGRQRPIAHCRRDAALGDPQGPARRR